MLAGSWAALPAGCALPKLLCLRGAGTGHCQPGCTAAAGSGAADMGHQAPKATPAQGRHMGLQALECLGQRWQEMGPPGSSPCAAAVQDRAPSPPDLQGGEGGAQQEPRAQRPQDVSAAAAEAPGVWAGLSTHRCRHGAPPPSPPAPAGLSGEETLVLVVKSPLKGWGTAWGEQGRLLAVLARTQRPRDTLRGTLDPRQLPLLVPGVIWAAPLAWGS